MFSTVVLLLVSIGLITGHVGEAVGMWWAWDAPVKVGVIGGAVTGLIMAVAAAAEGTRLLAGLFWFLYAFVGYYVLTWSAIRLASWLS